ncbi:MAG: hypothetical protein HW400_724 [Candidatus Levybacteria bacterium]|nr:hypothetical protein [Candidatus Levybacteria bacterium]
MVKEQITASEAIDPSNNKSKEKGGPCVKIFLPDGKNSLTMKRTDKMVTLFALFLNAYANQRHVYLSEVEKIYHTNEEKIVIPAMKKLRNKSVSAISRLRRLIEDTDPCWIITHSGADNNSRARTDFYFDLIKRELPETPTSSPTPQSPKNLTKSL